MPTFNRRSLLAGALGLAACGPARAEQEGLILRRQMAPGEDEGWYLLTQNGPYNPQPVPMRIPFGGSSVLVHWPRVRSSGRLVVFSHAALADPIAYGPLLQHWASHGFVVVAPVHDDSIFERGLLARRSSTTGPATWEFDRVLNDVLAWEARTEACRGPLEHADLISKSINMEVVTDRPIIVGHEFGAYVAQLLVGASVTGPDGKALSFADPRWFAASLISAQGAGVMGLTDGSWERVAAPLQVVQAGREEDFTRQTPEQKIQPFQRAQPGNKHLGFFPAAPSNLYRGPRAGVRQDEVLYDDFKAITTAFLLSYANYDEATFRAFASDWPDRATLGRVKTSYR